MIGTRDAELRKYNLKDLKEDRCRCDGQSYLAKSGMPERRQHAIGMNFLADWSARSIFQTRDTLLPFEISLKGRLESAVPQQCNV